MRGAPQSGLSRLIRRIKSCTSRGTTGRPIRPRRTFQVQNRRNPFRCHAITVSGRTIVRAERQLLQILERRTHNSRSAEVNFGRFLAERCRMPIW